MVSVTYQDRKAFTGRLLSGSASGATRTCRRRRTKHRFTRHDPSYVSRRVVTQRIAYLYIICVIQHLISSIENRRNLNPREKIKSSILNYTCDKSVALRELEEVKGAFEFLFIQHPTAMMICYSFRIELKTLNTCTKKKKKRK